MSAGSERERLLVRGVNWIGDAVMTLPALRALRAGCRDSEIHLMVKKWVEPLFQTDPNIDRIIEYREDYMGVKGKIAASRYLKRFRYGRAVLLQNAFDAAILAYLAGIQRREGYSRDGRGFLLTRAVAVTPRTKRLHHTLYYLNLLKEVGLKPVYRIPWIYLGLEERMKARGLLEGLSRPVVVLNPGATYGSAKRWPVKNFSSLAGLIIRDLGGSVVITGSAGERPIAEEIAGALDEDLRGSVRSMAGATPLRELIALISQADAVVSNDSGPMHIGYAVGTPVVAIFGSTDPALTGPPSSVHAGEAGFDAETEFGLRDRVIRRELDCSPCFERECPRGDTLCLLQIGPEEVLEALTGVVPSRRAVFFDRDGTLCRDVDYLRRMDDLEVFPEVGSLNYLKDKGYLLVGISNQSGIGRGMMERGFVERVNRIFIEEYGFDAFYYCPHHPDDNCACRKPSPGMALKAREELGVDLRSSIVVGDASGDMELAKGIGAEGILVRTGKEKDSRLADRVFDSLSEVVNYIAGDGR